MKIFVIYNGTHNNLVFVGKARTMKKAQKIIAQRIKKSGLKSYYWRFWMEEGNKTWIDYGSWSNFYVVEEKVI